MPERSSNAVSLRAASSRSSFPRDEPPFLDAAPADGLYFAQRSPGPRPMADKADGTVKTGGGMEQRT